MFERDDRGVTEVVGFVLVFSLMLGTIAVVYTTGFAGLQDTRDAERINNAERAFDVLANNFQKLAHNHAPNRATEIKLSEAQLEFGAQRQIGVTVDGQEDPISAPRSIKYTSTNGDAEIVYEAGAVIRVDGDSAVMVREPDFILDDRGVIRVIRPIKIGPSSVGGDRTVLIRASVRTTSLQYRTTTVDNDESVFIETAPERSAVWTEYFESTAAIDTCTQTNIDADTVRVECDLTLDSLSVARTSVDVEFT